MADDQVEPFFDGLMAGFGLGNHVGGLLAGMVLWWLGSWWCVPFFVVSVLGLLVFRQWQKRLVT